MHALLEDIHVDFKFSTREQSGSFAIYSMQIDNQLLTSSRPVVLSHDAPAPVCLVVSGSLELSYLALSFETSSHYGTLVTSFKSVSS